MEVHQFLLQSNNDKYNDDDDGHGDDDDVSSDQNRLILSNKHDDHISNYNNGLKMDMNKGMIYFDHNDTDYHDSNYHDSNHHTRSNERSDITIYNLNKQSVLNKKLNTNNNNNMINNNNNNNNVNMSSLITTTRNHNSIKNISMAPPVLFTHENSIANYLNKISHQNSSNSNNYIDNTTNISSSNHALLERNMISAQTNIHRQDDFKLFSLLG